MKDNNIFKSRVNEIINNPKFRLTSLIIFITKFSRQRF